MPPTEPRPEGIAAAVYRASIDAVNAASLPLTDPTAALRTARLTIQEVVAWFGEPRYSVTDLQRAYAQGFDAGMAAYLDTPDSSLASQADDPDCECGEPKSAGIHDAVRTWVNDPNKLHAFRPSQADDPSGPDVEAAWEGIEASIAGMVDREVAQALVARHRPIIEAAIRAAGVAATFAALHERDAAIRQESRDGG